MVVPLSVVCLLVLAGATSGEQTLHLDAGRRPWGAVNATPAEARSYRPAAQQEHHQQKWREENPLLARPAPRPDGKTSYHFRSSAKDVGVLHADVTPHRKAAAAVPVVSNSLRELMQTDSAGEGKDNAKKKRGEGDDDDEDKKTLSQQIADGKYGLIQKEIYPRPPLRPGIISYKNNPEVPSDTIKNLGGLDAEEIWLAEDHVLVLRGGWFPNHMNRTEVGSVWPPIDNYHAPPRQVKIPAKPKVPPPFPVQLKDGGPTHFIGPNGTKSLYPFPPPFFPYPPGDGFYPPPGNASSYPPPPFPYPPPTNGSYPPPQGNYPPPPENYPYPPDSAPYPYPPPPHGYMPFPNGTSPYGPLPPFFPPLPPGAALLPPPGNQTEYDEDDPSIYYPPPYDFFYPQDNTTNVPPGPLVPGIILPPPPNFFAPLNDDKPRAVKRPTSTPLPHVPLGAYPTPTASTKPNPGAQYYPSRPVAIPQATPRPHPPTTTSPPFYYPLPGREPSPTAPHAPVTSPPSSTPYGGLLPGPRPTVKRPYLTYVPVTTAQRKKKPRPSTTPKYEYEIAQVPVVLQATITAVEPPKPPKFVSPQHVQVFHKGESPIISRPFYYDDNAVTSTPDYGYNPDDNVITSTPRPNYITEGLSKLKDILYTTPLPTPLYPTDDRRKKQKYNSHGTTTVETVKSIEYTTESPLKYYTDFTRTPIYVKDLDNVNSYNQDPKTTTTKLHAVDHNSVHPTRQPYRDGKAGRLTTTQATLLDSYQPNRNPKATYYFYDEPHYEQGYVQDLPLKQNAYTPKWQYDNRPSQRPNYNDLGNVKTQEEQLLSQIAESLRQPDNGFYYNNPVKQPAPNNYYNANVRQPFFPNSKPLNGYSNLSTRPGFYIPRKPEYYPITTPSSYSSNTQTEREFPYSYEDVVQSTERPPPQLYASTQRPRYQSTRLMGPDIAVQTSPKTVYEYSYHKQPDASSNYVSTARPTPKRLAPARQPTTTHYYGEYSQSVTPDTNNQIYQSTTSNPGRKHPAIQPATPDPLSHYFTQQDDTVLDDITKKYFTIFGQKLRNGENSGGFVPMTTPLPPVVRDDKPRYSAAQQNNYANQPGSYAADAGPSNPTPIPLYDDIAVNYRSPRPPVNPDSELVNPHRHRYRGEEEDDSDTEGGKLISYKLPGNEGGHFYFVTPQVVKPQREGGAYQYPVPERGLRTRRNKTKQR